MEGCFLCHAGITRLERWPRESGPLWISPVTLQSFKSEEELQNHSKKVHQVLEAAVLVADKQAALVKGNVATGQDPSGRKAEQTT